MKKQTKRRLARSGLSFFLVAALILQGYAFVRTPTSARASQQPNGALKRVIVRYRGDAALANSRNTVADQVAELKQRQQWLGEQFSATPGYKYIIHAPSQLPFLIMNVDASGERSLKSNPNILSVEEDQILKPNMMDAVGLVGGSVATGFSDGSTNFTGDGTVIAVIDDGVDKSHPSLDGAVVSEACFSLPETEYTDVTVSSACPGGATSSTAADSGTPCDNDCGHGTAVAGAAAMRAVSATIDRDGGGPGDSETVNLSGIAKSAEIIAIKAMFKITEKTGQDDFCGNAGDETEVCYRPSIGLGVLGLNRVLELQNSGSLTGKVVSANFSVGSTTQFHDNEAQCSASSADATAYNLSAAVLKYANIAPIVAAGNSGNGVNQNKISSPGCLSNVIGVSATSKTNAMSTYSNAGPLTDLVAPGGDWSGSGDPFAQLLLLPEPGTGLETTMGTSFAAPIVAGAWAVVREKAPTASVNTILKLFQDTGLSVTENRSGYTAMSHKRISVDDALAAADDLPSISAVETEEEDIVGGSSVPVAVSTTNATSCQAYSGSTSVATGSVSSGTSTLNITAPSSVGNATYKIECSDAQNNIAQMNFVLSVATAGQGDNETPGPVIDDDNTDWVPGVPNAGAVFRARLLVSMSISVGLLLFLQRRLLFGIVGSKA